MNDKKPFFIIGILLIFSISFYFFFYQKELSDEEHLLQTSQNMTNLNSFSLDLELKMDFIGDYNFPNFYFLSSADIDRINKKMRTKTNTEIETDGTTMSFGINLKYINDSLYLDIATFPYLALQIMVEDISLLTENKILLKENLIKDINLLLVEMFEDAEKEPKAVTEITDKMYALFLEAVGSGVFSIKEAQKETLNDFSVKKYTVLVNSENLENFIFDLMERYNGYQFLFAEEDKKLKKENIKIWIEENFSDYSFNVWADSQAILKIQSVSEIEFPKESYPGEEVPEKVFLKTTFNFSNFNQNFEIEAPDEYLRLENILESVLSPFIFLQEDMVAPN